MARLSALFAAAAAVLAIVAEAKVNTTIPITETVTIDGAQIFGSSAGHSSLGQCAQFARDAVNDPARPSIEVCGTSTKVVVFLRNRCKDYYEYSHTIGTCNTGAPSSSCAAGSPATLAWLQTAQSYRIETC